MEPDIRNDVAIITGGARGIGAAITRALAQEGCRVAIWDREADMAEALAQAIRDQGGEAAAFAVDVASPASVMAATDAVLDRFGSIEILVNNAGLARPAPLLEITDDQWNLVLDVCLRGPFNCIRAVGPHMVARNYGRIVNISSRTAHGDVGNAHYAAAKAGVNGLTKTAALDLAPHWITVNAIAPGMIHTEGVRNMANYADLDTRARSRTPIQRPGEPEDIASAVAFLAARRNGFITGEIVHVTGGRFSS